MCNGLDAMQKLNANQLLYLRHLTLICEVNMAGIYDIYMQNKDVKFLARGLQEQANTPLKALNCGGQDDSDEDSEDLTAHMASGKSRPGRLTLARATRFQYLHAIEAACESPRNNIASGFPAFVFYARLSTFSKSPRSG